jgi:hypothetical protein
MFTFTDPKEYKPREKQRTLLNLSQTFSSTEDHMKIMQKALASIPEMVSVKGTIYKNKMSW